MGNLIKLENEYLIIIVAIVGAIYYFYKKENAKREKWESLYLNKILVPFHLRYLKKSFINTQKFLKKIDLYDKGYVPNYVFYLLILNDFDTIFKVLLVDYEWNSYTQKQLHSRSQSKTLNLIMYFVEWMLILLFVFSLLIVFIMGLSFFILFINGTLQFPEYTNSIITMPILIVLCFFIPQLLKIIQSNDDGYSTDVKTIKNSIEIRVKYYEKNFSQNLYQIRQGNKS